MDEKDIFQEAWQTAARRVNNGKHSRDSIEFFLADGETKKFDVPPMRDDAAKEEFLRLTLQAINNYKVEAILINYEAWFVDAPVKVEELNECLDNNPPPQKSPLRREGVTFYYEKSDGTIATGLAEIRTVKKRKRVLDPIRMIAHDNNVETRMNHLFQKATRLPRRDIIEEILGTRIKAGEKNLLWGREG